VHDPSMEYLDETVRALTAAAAGRYGV
jgi:hypothetical protein